MKQLFFDFCDALIDPNFEKSNIKNSVAVSREDLNIMELEHKQLVSLLNTIDKHDPTVLQEKVIQLKQSDGESWAVGELLQRAIFISGFRKSMLLDE